MHNILDCKAETANFLLWGCMGERVTHYSGTSSGGYRGTTAEQRTIGVELEVLKEEVAFKGLEQGLWSSMMVGSLGCARIARIG